ncbi:MAG: hypothetical protein JSV88_02525 [Candidatus Aminicenantes bacterium]|nr:MAG: hypothetical protein JSV88_02525 [Candidatus Aminicenantes bacterium]
MRKLTVITITIISLFFCFCLQAVEIMKVSEIKTGMEGMGKTIFQGTKIETFPFKVLGIIEKFSPNKDLIIVELDAPALNDSGIISGMSGSPAYIDGKLIGAIAYGFLFSKKPIGGITPIEDILETSEYNTPTFSIDISTIKMEFDKKNLSFISELIREELAHRLNFTPHESFSPIPLLGIQRGFRPSTFSYFPFLKPAFSAGDSLKITTNTNADASTTFTADPLKISPADVVTIPLIKGDFEYAAYGSVTHVDGDKIYAFGHPFFNLGTVDFPMHKGEVISVVPSFQESFKLVSTRNMVGRVVQDRFSAVQGELGKPPYLIPLKIFLRNRDHRFNIELVNHPLLTPLLSAFSILNVLTSEYQQVGFQSIKVDGKIFIEGEKNIVIDDLFSGQDSFINFSNLLLVINYFLMNNNEKNIKIQKMDFEIRGSEILRQANLENVLMDKTSFYPGEIMNITVYLRNERGRAFSESIQLKAPNLKASSEFYLMVADNQEMVQFDAKNVRTSYFPTKLSFLIRAINNLRKNNRMYFKLMTPSKGLFVKGHEYPNLPDSLQNVFTYNSTPIQGVSPGDQSQIKYSTIKEYQLEFPSVVRGKKLFKLKIKERTDDQ